MINLLILFLLAISCITKACCPASDYGIESPRYIPMYRLPIVEKKPTKRSPASLKMLAAQKLVKIGKYNKASLLPEELRFLCNLFHDNFEPRFGLNTYAMLRHIIKSSNIQLIPDMHALGADFNITPLYGCSPLYLAIREGNIPMVEALIAHGALVNQEHRQYGDYPLMEAAETGNIEMVKFLVEKGADINKRNVGHGGHTALDYAKKSLDCAKSHEQAEREQGCKEIVQFLEDYARSKEKINS